MTYVRCRTIVPAEAEFPKETSRVCLGQPLTQDGIQVELGDSFHNFANVL